MKEIMRKVFHPVDPGRSLHFISAFLQLVKCIQNASVTKGVQITIGHTNADVIKETWKDMDSLTLKVMLHFTHSHTHPSEFEKMRMN